jgi:hypothetical protein
MKQTFSVIVLFLVIVSAGLAKAPQPEQQNRTQESIVGVWKGKFEQTPAVDITLKVDSGKLSGTAVFYFVQNTDDGQVVKSTPKAELLEPSFDGKQLSVKIKRPDGSFFKATLKFIADNDAILKPVDDPAATDEMAISLTREK